jgi:hypothetical protein
METKVKNYTPWEEIQEQYPDKFVLMKDLEFDHGLVIGGTVVYAHQDRQKVIDKDVELRIYHTTMRYTCGVRGDIARKMLRIFCRSNRHRSGLDKSKNTHNPIENQIEASTRVLLVSLHFQPLYNPTKLIPCSSA